MMWKYLFNQPHPSFPSSHTPSHSHYVSHISIMASLCTYIWNFRCILLHWCLMLVKPIESMHNFHMTPPVLLLVDWLVGPLVSRVGFGLSLFPMRVRSYTPIRALVIFREVLRTTCLPLSSLLRPTSVPTTSTWTTSAATPSTLRALLPSSTWSGWRRTWPRTLTGLPHTMILTR